jgi:serine/threonine protein kinase
MKISPVAHKTAKNMVASRQDMNDIALFEIDEIRPGRLLGEGGFCTVRVLRGVNLKHDDTVTNDAVHHDYSPTDRVIRNELKFNCKSRCYAIKTIRPERLRWKRSFKAAVRDLEMEAYLLSRIHHPNIITLRGMSSGGFKVDTTCVRRDTHFLILDRLKETLNDRITRWKLEINRSQRGIRVSMLNHDRIRKRNQKLFMEQLTVAYGIASALEYLHSLRIIYRDLKSNNCGFDGNNKCLLFDFGLARRLPEQTEHLNDVFKMSGQTGTVRYMSPEVFRCEPYGLKADVYSFAHLLWEILSLEPPYIEYSKENYRHRVIKKGIRPAIDPFWPVEIQDLLRSAWAAEADERLTMKQVCKILKDVLTKVKSTVHLQRIASRKAISPNDQGEDPSEQKEEVVSCDDTCSTSASRTRWLRFRSHSII